MNTNTLLIIGGLAVIGVGGFFLLKDSKKSGTTNVSLPPPRSDSGDITAGELFDAGEKILDIFGF